MKENFSHEAPLSIDQALMKITMSEQQAQVMGANDYEPSAFNTIKQNLKDGNMTPTEAVAAAESVLNNKQDYH